VASVLMLATGAKLDFTDYPRLTAWLNRCRDRPAYRSVTAGRS
jgi:glutathione S-transferase